MSSASDLRLSQDADRRAASFQVGRRDDGSSPPRCSARAWPPSTPPSSASPLPTIGRDFDATIGTLQWVVTGYTLTLAALLLLGGSLGDRFGRRRVFCIGVVWFTISSAPVRRRAGLDGAHRGPSRTGDRSGPPDPGEPRHLAGARSPRGPGTGDRRLVGPRRRGLGGRSAPRRLPDQPPRRGGGSSSSTSPSGSLVLALCVRHVPESTGSRCERSPRRARARSLAWLSLAALTYGLIEGPSTRLRFPGGHSDTLGRSGRLCRLRRCSNEPRRAPMLPLGLFRQRQFSVTNAVTLIVYAALGGALFLVPVELQVVNGYSPLRGGRGALPLTAIMLVLSARSDSSPRQDRPPAPDGRRACRRRGRPGAC